MKAKFFWGITILLSMVMLFGCSNEVVLEQEQSQMQNSELIKEYPTLITQNKYGMLIQIIDQQGTLPNWRNLSQDELESVMKLVADEFVKLGGTNNLNKMPNWSSKDDYDLNLATSLGVNALVKKYLNKQVNQASSGEILDVIDNAPTQEFDDLIRSFATRENVKALIDRRGKPSYSIHQAGTRSLETRNSCHGYKYKVRTTIGGSGNVSCIGYADATNEGDSDCDYEFTFPWGRPRTQPTLQLTTDSWRLKGILLIGKINGRYHNRYQSVPPGSGITPDCVSFLIGKGRISAAFLEPEDVVRDLKGSW
jgi:lipoprotein